MTRGASGTLTAVLLGALMQTGVTTAQAPSRDQKPAAPVAPVASHAASLTAPSLDAVTGVVRQYCTTCHNDRSKAGGLTLATFDAGHAAEDVVVTEKMI